MKYGYARVSTIDQKLESQIEQLKNAGAEEIFQEKFTGTTVERPQFNLVLKKLENGDIYYYVDTDDPKVVAETITNWYTTVQTPQDIADELAIKESKVKK